MSKAKGKDATVGEIMTALTALQMVGTLNLNAKLAYRLAHNRKVATEIGRIFEFSQDQVVQRLAEKDEDGNVVKMDLPNGLERVKFGSNQNEAAEAIQALRNETAPMDDFRYLSMSDLDEIQSAAADDFPIGEVIFGLYPIIRE